MVNSGAFRQHLPALHEKLQTLEYAMRKAPEVASRELVAAVRYDHRRQEDPYGTAWAPTQDGHRYDPQGHVRDGWVARVEGLDVKLENTHRAAGFLGKSYKGRPARLMHPDESRGLGIWGKRVQRMLRRLLYAGSLTEAQRQDIKAKAEARAAVRAALKAERQRTREVEKSNRARDRAIRRAADRQRGKDI